MSYLDGSFLADGESYDAGDATIALSPALGENPNSGDEIAMILPGGIIVTKKMLWVILGAVAVAVLVVYMKRKRDREPKAIEG
jgi:hypothetical protein